MRAAPFALVLLAAPFARADVAPTLAPTDVRGVEVVRGGAWVRWGTSEHSRRMAMMRRGTRVAVRGVVRVEESRACRTGEWFAIEPMGFVCSSDVQATVEPPGGPEVLEVPAGRVLPHRYGVIRADATPIFEGEDAARSGASVGVLGKGTKIILRGRAIVDGNQFVKNRRGQLVPRDAVGYMGGGSEWGGVALDPRTKVPFGWATARRTRVYATPDGGRSIDRIEFRTRIDVLEEQGGFVRIGEGRWVRDSELGIVRTITRPTGTGPGPKWIDVDQGEQTLVLYEGQTPVFATLISSGRHHKTPRGDYPIWAKIAEITMDNQPYEDRAYTVEGVPWVLFFQEHNALHATYWHDAFGRAASHGCVNLSPKDARFVYDWAMPALPPGWQSFMPENLQTSTFVHVRDTSRDIEFRQDRRIGPPDPAVEARRLRAAEARRAAEAQAAAESEGLATQ